MPKRVLNLELDINKTSYNNQFTAKQFEDLELNLTLKDKTNILNLNDCIVNFACDKNLIFSCDVVEDKIKVVIESESVIETGVYEAELSIDDKEGTLKTPSFYFMINKSLIGEVIVTLKTLLDLKGNILKDSENNYLKVRG